jgi:hypothetical protein
MCSLNPALRGGSRLVSAVAAFGTQERVSQLLRAASPIAQACGSAALCSVAHFCAARSPQTAMKSAWVVAGSVLS